MGLIPEEVLEAARKKYYEQNPTPAMVLVKTAHENPGASVSELAVITGHSRSWTRKVLMAAGITPVTAKPKGKSKAEILVEVYQEDPTLTVAELSEASSRSERWVRKVLKAARHCAAEGATAADESHARGRGHSQQAHTFGAEGPDLIPSATATTDDGDGGNGMTFIEKRGDLRGPVGATKEERLKHTLEWYRYVREAKEPVEYGYRAVGYLLDALRPFDLDDLPDFAVEYTELIHQLWINEVTAKLDRE